MIPDLGKYALWVLASYGIGIGLLGAVTLASILQALRVRRMLREMEAGRKRPRDEAAEPTPGGTAREVADG
jgi:heme exporter protein CcmD